jgi:hypothetical protein
MALAWVQHDLYFSSGRHPWLRIEGRCTLTWIWSASLRACATMHSTLPWVRRNLPRMRRVDGFNHKILQLPHEHIAAYFRWTMPRVVSEMVLPEDPAYPRDLLGAWCEFLLRDIPDLFRNPEAAMAIPRMVLYDNFDYSDGARDAFHRILFERYGYECVSSTWWAPKMAARLGALKGAAA